MVLPLTIPWQGLPETPRVTEPPSSCPQRYPEPGARHCPSRRSTTAELNLHFYNSGKLLTKANKPLRRFLKTYKLCSRHLLSTGTCGGCFLMKRSQSISGSDMILRRDAGIFQELTVVRNPQTTHQVSQHFCISFYFEFNLLFLFNKAV